MFRDATMKLTNLLVKGEPRRKGLCKRRNILSFGQAHAGLKRQDNDSKSSCRFIQKRIKFIYIEYTMQNWWQTICVQHNGISDSSAREGRDECGAKREIVVDKMYVELPSG